MSPILGVKEQKCLLGYARENESLLNCSFQNSWAKTFGESVERISRNRQPNMTKNEHVYAVCCRPEVAGDVILGESVKTIEGYAVLNFEVATFSSFRDIFKKSFRDGGGGGHRQ